MAATTLFDMARMTTGTTGTGTITLGAAVQSFLTFAGAGVADQTVVRYLIEDPPNREVGNGTYTASGTTLTRNVVFSTNSNAAISLSGNAQVALTALAEDITNKNGDTLQGALNWAGAVSLSSASTVNIGAAGSNYVIITGTTTITAFDTIAQGAERIVRFAGSLTITNNNTSLICKGGNNINTAAGDVTRFISEGSGNWRMLEYTKASGTSATILSPTVSIFTSSATVTIPSAATKCKVTLVGGGGGGGGSAASSCAPGSGGPGGPGGVLIKYLSGLTGGNTLSLTIGAGGSAGSSAPGAGGNGGDTSLSSGTQTINATLTASHGAGGAAGGGVNGAAGAAGGGTNGDLNITGGNNGGTGLGFGPTVVTFGANSAGTAGVGYGGAGSGGTTPSVGGNANAGGAGAAGVAIFEWYL